jgi:hypothetical protein
MAKRKNTDMFIQIKTASTSKPIIKRIERMTTQAEVKKTKRKFNRMTFRILKKIGVPIKCGPTQFTFLSSADDELSKPNSF